MGRGWVSPRAFTPRPTEVKHVEWLQMLCTGNLSAHLSTGSCLDCQEGKMKSAMLQLHMGTAVTRGWGLCFPLHAARIPDSSLLAVLFTLLGRVIFCSSALYLNALTPVIKCASWFPSSDTSFWILPLFLLWIVIPCVPNFPPSQNCLPQDLTEGESRLLPWYSAAEKKPSSG